MKFIPLESSNEKKKTSAKHCEQSTMLCSLLTAYKRIKAQKCEQKQRLLAFVPRGVPVSKTETYIKHTQSQQTHILLRKFKRARGVHTPSRGCGVGYVTSRCGLRNLLPENSKVGSLKRTQRKIAVDTCPAEKCAAVAVSGHTPHNFSTSVTLSVHRTA